MTPDLTPFDGVFKKKRDKKTAFLNVFAQKSRFFGDPNGIRTHDTTVKGWCLNRLTMGPLVQALYGGLSPPAFPL